jgi:hypothetical protein
MEGPSQLAIREDFCLLSVNQARSAECFEIDGCAGIK